MCKLLSVKNHVLLLLLKLSCDITFKAAAKHEGDVVNFTCLGAVAAAYVYHYHEFFISKSVTAHLLGKFIHDRRNQSLLTIKIIMTREEQWPVI